MISKIVILGSGNVASNFVSVLKNTDIRILQIFNRHAENARDLANSVDAEVIDDIEKICPDADAYFFMLSDTGIIEMANKIKINRGILVHTAGSVSMNIFKGKSEHYGVFYPFQTFSKEFPPDFSKIPVCLETSDTMTFDDLTSFAGKLGCKTYNIDENKRKIIHLSGVFACNFMNHCIFLGENILESAGIEKDILYPLLEQSFKKVLSLGAERSQTGPAKRNDVAVINEHLELLKDNKSIYTIYKVLTDSIYKSNN